MKICVDLDKTIAEPKKPEQSYWEIKPKEGVVEKLNQWRQQGHYIIIHTARHMLSMQGNMGLINEVLKPYNEKWLEKWNIPYDELIMGKPFADVYVDDKALKFEDNWNTIQLPVQG